MLNNKYTTPLHLAVLALFIILSYYPSLDVPFVFDDIPNIVLNPAVHPGNITELGRSLHSRVSANRPLAMLSFAVNYLGGGLDVFGYHLINILIHLINAGLLYFICLDLLKIDHRKDPHDDPHHIAAIAFFSTALWALNPVQTQAVTYIVQRMTAMATLFYMAAILTFIRWRFADLKPRTAIISIGVFFLAGLATKEIVATLPLTLILIELCFRGRPKRQHFIWLGLAAILFIITGIYYLHGHLPDWQSRYPSRNFSPWQRVMSQWRVLWHYLSLYILPLPARLHLTYDMPISTGLLKPASTLASLVAILASLFAAWKLCRHRAITSFAIFFFFLANAIEASFVNLEMVFIHRIYLPSIFLGLGLLNLLPIRYIKRLHIILLIIMSLLALATISRNAAWQDTAKFWQADFTQGGTPARSLNNQAAALIDSGDFNGAIAILKKAVPLVETHDDLRITLYNSGFANFYGGNFSPALKYFTALTSKYGAYKDAWLFIGKIYIGQGKTAEAERLAQRLQAQPQSDLQGKILMAMLAAKRQDYSSAEKILRRCLRALSPTQIEAYMQTKLQLARIYLLDKKEDKAYEIFLQVTRDFPQNYSAWTMIYLMLKAGGDEEAATTVAKFLTTRGIKIKKPDSGNPRIRPQN